MNILYNPKPIDTTDIALSEEMKQLVELLAHNVHDTWAQGRINEGWTWGAKRDDAKKQHPCLVPYEELPESEKDYDRRTATTTLKTLIKMGWNIERNDMMEGHDALS